MPIVPAKCTNCGAPLQVDSGKKAAVCPYCNEAYIVEEAINNYNYVTYQTTNIAHADVVQVSDDHGAQARITAGNKFLELREYDKAKLAFMEACNLAPQDYQGWWGQVQADFGKGIIVSEYDSRYRNALETAPAEVVSQIEEEYRSLVAREKIIQNELDRITNEAEEINAHAVSTINALWRGEIEAEGIAESFRSQKGSSFLAVILRIVAGLLFLATIYGLLSYYVFGGAGDEYPILSACSFIVGVVALFLAKPFVKAKKKKNNKLDQSAYAYQKFVSAFMDCRRALSDAQKELQENLSIPFSAEYDAKETKPLIENANDLLKQYESFKKTDSSNENADLLLKEYRDSIKAN